MTTTWINGDEVEYSGDTVELYGGVFYVTHRVSDGKELLTPRSPQGINRAVGKRRQEWVAQQDDFRKLNGSDA